MKDYNFEDENNIFGETVRIDDINKKVQDHENKTPEKTGENHKIKGHKKGLFTGPGGGRRTYVFIALACLVVFLCVFIVTLVSTFVNNDPGGEVLEDQNPPVLALVKEIKNNGEITLYEIDTNENITVTTNDKTEYLNVTPGGIEVGDVVIATYNEDYTASKIEYNSDCFKLENISGIKIDTESKKITVENKKYIVSEGSIYKYMGKNIELTDIESVDVLNIKGAGDTIWFIDVIDYHGYIDILNKDKIENGSIIIDDKEPIALNKTEKIAVTQGIHKIVIQGDNIETYASDIYVILNESFEVDLSNTQEKTGIIIIKSNVKDYKLFVNGTEVANITKPLVLPLGEYTLKMTKEGYIGHEGTILLEDTFKEIAINLEADIKYGKLMITSDPVGGAVYIDGTYTGATPLEATLEYGEHLITIKKDGYKDYSIPIMINTTTTPISVKLQ